MIQTNMVLAKRLKVFGLLNWSRRLIVIQKLQRLKTRYVVLLVYSIMGCYYKFAKIESKRPNVINLSTNAVLTQKLQRLEIKYLILPLLSTPDLLTNILTKLNFDAKIRKAGKSLVTISEIKKCTRIMERKYRKKYSNI